jgi:YidC/Oxa1 family membrane protein insertase
MDTQRLILLFIFSFSLLMLWGEWDRYNRPKQLAESAQPQTQGVPAPAQQAPAGQAKPPAASVPASLSR